MKSNTLNNFWAALKFGRPYIGLLILNSCCNLITICADLGFLYLLKRLVDTGFASQNLSLLQWLALGALGILLLRSIFGYAGGYLSTYVDGRMANDIQNQLYAQIQQLSLEFHVQNTTGNLLAIIFYHTHDMLQLITSLSGTMLRDLLRIPALVIFLFSLHSGLALFALLVFPPALMAVQVFRNLINRITQKVHETLSQLYTTTEQTLSHIQTVKMFAKETDEAERFEDLNEQMLSQSIQTYKVTGLSNPAVQLLKMLGITVLVFLGIREVARNTISVGGLTTFIAAAYYFYGSLSGLASWYLSLPSSLLSAEKVLKVLNARPTVLSPPHGIKLSRFEKDVMLHRVSFHYPSEGSDVLKSITIRVPKGETIAVVGPSGSGKSTLIKLLLRLYDPSEGSLSIDGHNFTDVDLKSLREIFGVAPQHAGIFQDTIVRTIAYGRPLASPAEIQEAARLAGAHEFIVHLPLGYDTPIGERGAKLSGGEQQRLALARALVKNPEILVLDEALSSVDAPTERAILQRITSQRQGRTTLLISHRLASIAHADRIVVIEKGCIIEQGNHRKLIAAETKYREWFLTQQSAPASVASLSDRF